MEITIAIIAISTMVWIGGCVLAKMIVDRMIRNAHMRLAYIRGEA